MNRFTSIGFDVFEPARLPTSIYTYYLLSGHVTKFDFQMRYLGVFRLGYAQIGGMDSPVTLCRKIKLFPA